MFPQELVNAFLKWTEDDTEENYAIYRQFSENFLKGKFGDRIEECHLIVELTRHILQLQ